MCFDDGLIDDCLHLPDALDLQQSQNPGRLLDVFVLLVHALAFEDWKGFALEDRLLESFLVEIVFNHSADGEKNLEMIGMVRNRELSCESSNAGLKTWAADCGRRIF